MMWKSVDGLLKASLRMSCQLRTVSWPHRPVDIPCVSIHSNRRSTGSKRRKRKTIWRCVYNLTSITWNDFWVALWHPDCYTLGRFLYTRSKQNTVKTFLSRFRTVCRLKIQIYPLKCSKTYHKKTQLDSFNTWRFSSLSQKKLDPLCTQCYSTAFIWVTIVYDICL